MFGRAVPSKYPVPGKRRNGTTVWPDRQVLFPVTLTPGLPSIIVRAPVIVMVLFVQGAGGYAASAVAPRASPDPRTTKHAARKRFTSISSSFSASVPYQVLLVGQGIIRATLRTGCHPEVNIGCKWAHQDVREASPAQINFDLGHLSGSYLCHELKGRNTRKAEGIRA